MFISYVKDMKSWILLFIFMLGLVNVLIWIDKGIRIQLSSLMYMDLLLSIVFMLFFLWRYKRETSFTKALSSHVEGTMDDWQEALPRALFIRDELTNEVLRAVADENVRKLSKLKSSLVIESDFTAAWVHEVKAPLTAMKLTIDAHKKDPAIRKIESEWLRIHLLVEQQLYISRLPSLESDYVLEDLEVNKLVGAEVRELASWCIEKNIAVEIIGEDVHVVTDSKWSRFIIRQLVTNAIKYSPSGGILTITTNVLPNGNAILAIKDEGPGIPQHELPRIFDKGFTGGTGRIHNAATGLGLYLAQTVAEKIGITLFAESDSTQGGTLLTVTFSKKNDFDSTIT